MLANKLDASYLGWPIPVSLIAFQHSLMRCLTKTHQVLRDDLASLSVCARGSARLSWRGKSSDHANNGGGNLFAYVRKAQRAPPQPTSSHEKFVKCTSDDNFVRNGVLRRVLGSARGIASEMDSIGSARSIPSNKNGGSPKPSRLRRRHMQVDKNALATHPCVLQDEHHMCRARQGLCPFEHLPADLCLEQLRTGRCRLNAAGSCPWKHDAGRCRYVQAPTGGGLAVDTEWSVDSDVASVTSGATASWVAARQVIQTFRDALMALRVESMDSSGGADTLVPPWDEAVVAQNGEGVLGLYPGRRLCIARTFVVCALAEGDAGNAESNVEHDCSRDTAIHLMDADRMLSDAVTSLPFVLSEIEGGSDAHGLNNSVVVLSRQVSNFVDALVRRDIQDGDSDRTTQLSLRDAVCYQVVHQLDEVLHMRTQELIESSSGLQQSPRVGDEADDVAHRFGEDRIALAALLHGMSFLSAAPGERVSTLTGRTEIDDDPSNATNVSLDEGATATDMLSTLFMCHHPQNHHAAGAEPLSPTVGAPPMLVLPMEPDRRPLSLQRSGYLQHVAFWSNYLNTVGRAVFLLWRTAPPLELVTQLIAVTTRVGRDLSACYRPIVLRCCGVGGSGRDVSDDALFGRSPLSMGPESYVRDRTLPLRSSFVSTQLQHYIAWCGAAAGLMLGPGQLPMQPPPGAWHLFGCISTAAPAAQRCAPKPCLPFVVRDAQAVQHHRRFVPTLDALFGALKAEAQFAAKERQQLRNMFEHRRERWLQAQGKDSKSEGGGRRGGPLQRHHGRGAGGASMATPPLDEILPIGTVAASAHTTQVMLRSLFVRGKPYKCLKMCVGMLRTSDVLRRAAAAAAASDNAAATTNRASMWTKKGKAAAQPPLPPPSIDMYFGMNADVAHDMMLVMGVLGHTKLLDVLWSGLIRRSIVDATSRCLTAAPATAAIQTAEPMRAAEFIDRSLMHIQTLLQQQQGGGCSHGQPLRRVQLDARVVEAALYTSLTVSHQLASTGDPDVGPHDEALPSNGSWPRIETLRKVVDVLGTVQGQPFLDPSSAFVLFEAFGRLDAVTGYALCRPLEDMHALAALPATRSVRPTSSSELRSHLAAQVSGGNPPDGTHTDASSGEGSPSDDRASKRSRDEERWMLYQRRLGVLSSAINGADDTGCDSRDRRGGGAGQRRSIALAAGCGLLRGLTATQTHRLCSVVNADAVAKLFVWTLEAVRTNADAEALMLALFTSTAVTLGSGGHQRDAVGVLLNHHVFPPALRWRDVSCIAQLHTALTCAMRSVSLGPSERWGLQEEGLVDDRASCHASVVPPWTIDTMGEHGIAVGALPHQKAQHRDVTRFVQALTSNLVAHVAHGGMHGANGSHSRRGAALLLEALEHPTAKWCAVAMQHAPQTAPQPQQPAERR